MNTLRCSICDSTNNMNVANHGGWLMSKRGFIRDPADPSGNSMICLKCNEEIIEASREYFVDLEDLES